MSKIRVLIVEPNKEPYVKIIENTLKNLQEIVGGLIEIVELNYNVNIICNEEGKMTGLPLNRVIKYDVIVGTFIITGQYNGETISLSKQQISKCKKIFSLAKHQRYINFLKQNIRNEKFLNDVDKLGIEKAIETNIKKEQ